MIFVFQLMFFDTQISIRNRLGYVCIEYAASGIGHARIEDVKVKINSQHLVGDASYQLICQRLSMFNTRVFNTIRSVFDTYVSETVAY